MTAPQPSKYDHAPRWRRRPALGDAPACYMIYRQPGDFEGYVIREYRVDPEGLTPLGWVRGSAALSTVRIHIPEHTRRRLNRAPDDDPVILETWF